LELRAAIRGKSPERRSESWLSPCLQKRRAERVLHQHRDRHRSDPAGHRGNRECTCLTCRRSTARPAATPT